MARLPRLVVPGLPHLIIHRGHNGQDVFLDDADRVLYLSVLASSASEAGVALHGYGLQTGEVRLLATPSNEGALAQMMQALGRRYVRFFNLKHSRSSTPWEGRFRSTVIEPERYFVPALLVVENSVSPGTGLASGREASAWTSAVHHLGLRVEPLVTEHAVFWGLGNTPFEREAGYRVLFERGLSLHEVDTILRAATKGWALGTPEFAARLGKETGRRTQPLPRGRPGKGRSLKVSLHV